MRLMDDTGKGHFTDAFSPVLHASGLRLHLRLTCSLMTWTSLKLLRKANCNRATATLAIYTFPLLLVFPRILPFCYRLRKPLYGMPSAARAWFQTMSTFLKPEGCTKVGYEESMRKTAALHCGHDILLATHIDDFIIACRDRPTLDAFRARLLDHFVGSYEGDIRTYLSCEIERDMDKGITPLSQKHYAEEVSSSRSRFSFPLSRHHRQFRLPRQHDTT
jgi:hypothetical protein